MRKGIVALGLGVAALVGLLAAPARAVQEELLDEARKIVLEAKPLVEQANNVDLEMEQRRAPRREAFTKLKRARDLFDKYIDANPAAVEKLDKELCDIVALIFWLKKDSGLGELEKEAPPPELPGGGVPGAPPAPAPGGEGGKSDKPPPANPPGAEPGPPKNEAPSDFAFRAKRQLSAIADYEKTHVGDLPNLKQLYEKFLAEFSDPSLPEYAAAVEKLGKINDQLKTVLKEVAKRDPDSLSGPDTKAESAIFGRLLQDFNSKDPDTRLRAAKLMAASRARAAANFLARGLCDKDEEFAKVCRGGLIALGGKYVGEKLVEYYRDKSKDRQQAAMDVFNEVTKKGSVDAAAESPSIGHFVLSAESDIAEEAMNLLTRMGKLGGPGLMFGLDSKVTLKKCDTMKALAEVKYYKAARTIGERYLDTKVARPVHDAAMESLEKMGAGAVPYLIPCLGNAYCPLVLRKITGDETIILGDEKKVRAWWNKNKPPDADPGT